MAGRGKFGENLAMAVSVTETITTIDGHYKRPGRAAAYLIHEGDEAAFVDNVTRFSVPYLLDALSSKGLQPEQVRYLIVTHIHLDHSGGTAELAKACPNATVICHPRAARHIADPTRLVEGATAVYGEKVFNELFGEICPIDESRIRSMEDGETLPLGSRTLTFLHSPGHAKHHFIIQDSKTNSMFAGDAFGIFYPQLQHGSRPFIDYVCAPPQFDPSAAKTTIRRIVKTGVDRVFVTHFGLCDFVCQGAEELLTCMDLFDVLVDKAAESDLGGDALLDECTRGGLAIMKQRLESCGLDPQQPLVMQWATAEHSITSQGLAHLAEQRREQSQA